MVGKIEGGSVVSGCGLVVSMFESTWSDSVTAPLGGCTSSSSSVSSTVGMVSVLLCWMLGLV